MANIFNSTETAARQPWMAAIIARLKGPGGYYNMGNLLGLMAGTGVHLAGPSGSGPASLNASAHATFDYIAGSPSAIFLSLAMVVFFLSGEVYHRAWSNGAPPDVAQNRRGDVLSGIGAVFLGLGLLITGQPMLAATAGLLHAIGKFGSAWAGVPCAGVWPARWPDLWRSMVLASRVPAVLAAGIGFATLGITADLSPAVIAPATLIACYVLWIRADLMLFVHRI